MVIGKGAKFIRLLGGCSDPSQKEIAENLQQTTIRVAVNKSIWSDYFDGKGDTFHVWQNVSNWKMKEILQQRR